MSLTFEDVEIAIKILEEYLRLARKAENLLRQVRATQSQRMISPYAFSFQDIMNIAMEMEMRKRGIVTEKEEEEEMIITEDDVIRMRKAKEKIDRKIKPTTQIAEVE